mgnify:CR=1 FL=1
MDIREDVKNDVYRSVRKKKPGQYWLTSFKNVLKTGHCAPAVMRTLLEIQGAENERIMLLASGMGGGVGLTEAECGCVTSPVMTLGLMFGEETDENGIPKVVSLGQYFMEKFKDANGSIICGQLAPNKRDFRACMKSMCSAPGLLVELTDEKTEVVTARVNEELLGASKTLLSHFSDCDFHCAQTVLKGLADVIEVDDELLRASYGFFGGTVLKGFTCSALTAGVLAIGSEFGGIESSYVKVFNMMRLFMFNTDAAMNVQINNANHAMNVSYDLAQRFEREFGSTICNQIVQENLSTNSGVRNYISGQRIGKCQEISAFVAETVRKTIDEGLEYDEPAKKWQ